MVSSASSTAPSPGARASRWPDIAPSRPNSASVAAGPRFHGALADASCGECLAGCFRERPPKARPPPPNLTPTHTRNAPDPHTVYQTVPFIHDSDTAASTGPSPWGIGGCLYGERLVTVLTSQDATIGRWAPWPRTGSFAGRSAGCPWEIVDVVDNRGRCAESREVGLDREGGRRERERCRVRRGPLIRVTDGA